MSKPIRTFGSFCFGSLCSTESNKLGLNLAAQPAALTIAVKRVLSSITNWIIGPTVQKANASPLGIGWDGGFECGSQRLKISIASRRAGHILVSRKTHLGKRLAALHPAWRTWPIGRDAEGVSNEEEDDSRPFLENASS